MLFVSRLQEGLRHLQDRPAAQTVVAGEGGDRPDLGSEMGATREVLFVLLAHGAPAAGGGAWQGGGCKKFVLGTSFMYMIDSGYPSSRPLVRSHKERKYSVLGPTQIRISPSIL